MGRIIQVFRNGAAWCHKVWRTASRLSVCLVVTGVIVTMTLAIAIGLVGGNPINMIMAIAAIINPQPNLGPPPPPPPPQPQPQPVLPPVPGIRLSGVPYNEVDIPGGGVSDLFYIWGTPNVQELTLEKRFGNASPDQWVAVHPNAWSLRTSQTAQTTVALNHALAWGTSPDSRLILDAEYLLRYEGRIEARSAAFYKWSPEIRSSADAWTKSGSSAIKSITWCMTDKCIIMDHRPRTIDSVAPRFSTISIPVSLTLHAPYEIEIHLRLIDTNPADGHGVRLSLERGTSDYVGCVLFDSNATSYMMNGESRLSTSHVDTKYSGGTSHIRIRVLRNGQGATTWSAYRRTPQDAEYTLDWSTSVSHWRPVETVSRLVLTMYGNCDIHLYKLSMSPYRGE